MTEIIPIKGSELKIILKKKRITQNMLSDFFGIHRTTISRYFTDDIQMPASFILKVAVYAKLDIKDLITSGYIGKSMVVTEPEVPYVTKKQDEVKAEPIIKLNFTVLEKRLIYLENEMRKVKSELKDFKKY